MMEVMRKSLSSRLLHRTNEKIIFSQLQHEHMDKIANIGLNEVDERLQRSQIMSVVLSLKYC